MRFFVESELIPPEHVKYCIEVFHPRRTGMLYVTRRSHRMQKHKFGVMCPDVLFVESLPVPPEQEKKCINISYPGCTKMPYVTHRFQ
jgi:hypothetical protein